MCICNILFSYLHLLYVALFIYLFIFTWFIVQILQFMFCHEIVLGLKYS